MSGYPVRDLVRALDRCEVDRFAREWLGPDAGNGAGGIARLERELENPEAWRRRLLALTAPARKLFEAIAGRADHCVGVREVLEGSAARAADRALAELESRALVFRIEDNKISRSDEPALAVPHEIAEALAGERRRGVTPLEVTLKEHLERRRRPRSERDQQHLRQAYKLFASAPAARKRIARLEPPIRDLVVAAIERCGGVMPRSLGKRLLGETSVFDREDLDRQLAEALVGRCGEVDLRPYGIASAERTLIVFQEVCFAFLRSAAEARQPQPEREQVAGVDLVTNLMRFLHYLDERPVRLTAKGRVFKATRGRIVTHLVGGHEDGEEIFEFLFRFMVSRRLVTGSGERTLRPTDAAREFEGRDLTEKLRALLAFAVEDPSCGGDPFHQVKLRRTLLRILRRVETGRWYEAMYVPFLARNAYLAQMDRQGVAAYYEDLRRRGRSALVEDPQKLCWHLFRWVATRLHLLGIVDLGYDGSGHPIAIRLSNLGARLLTGVPAQAADGQRSTLIVNPDYEILLFPEADAFELVHTIDRFARRISSDRLFRFAIDEETVRGALADGMGIGEILEVLTDRCRAPLPQNVLFSLVDWGDRAGAVLIDPRRRLSAHDPEVVTRLLEHRRVRQLTTGGPEDLRLKEDVRLEDFRELLRDLGFFLVAEGVRPESA